MKKLAHSVVYLLMGVLLLAGLLAGFTQTRFFRDRVREFALKTLDSLLLADVYIGPISGNLVTGFSVDSVALTVEGREAISARRLSLRYNVLGLLSGRSSFDRLILVSPVVRLERRPGERWNIEKIVRLAPVDTSALQGPPSLPAFEIDKLEIHDGTLELCDSSALADPAHGPREPGALEYHDFRLTDVQLALAASMGGRRAEISVKNISCFVPEHEFRLRRFSGDVRLSPDGASLSGAEILTENSSVALTASLGGTDLLDGLGLEKLRDLPVMLKLDAGELDFADMTFFLPVLSFLRGPVTLHVEAQGPYGDLDVQRLEVGFGSSTIALRGRVAHLDDPGNLFLDLSSPGMVIRGDDPAGLMPYFGLEPLAFLGESDIELSYRGTPLDFAVQLGVRSPVGVFRSDSLHLSIGGPSVLRYSGDVAIENVDLAAVTGDSSFRSRLTGDLRIEGEGVGMRALRGSLRAQFNRSEFRGMRMGPTRLVIEAFENRIGAFAGLTLGGMQAILSGELDVREQYPPFSVNGSVASVNLAPLLGDRRYDSDITAVLNIHGRGLSADSMSFDALLDLTSTRYGNYTLDSGVVRCRLDQLGGGARRLRVESRLADMSIEGAFDLEYVGAIAAHRVEALRDNIERGLEPWTSNGRRLKSVAELHRMEQELEDLRRPLDARYSITIKDLEPVSAVAGQRAFNGRGRLTGSLSGDHTDLSFSANLEADEFFYGNVESGILLKNALATFSVDHLLIDSPLRSTRMHLDATAWEFHLNDSRLDSMRALVSLDSTRLDVDFAGTLDESFAGALRGSGRMTPDSLDLDLIALALGPGELLWLADPGAHLTIGGGTASLDRLILRRGEEEIRVRAAVTAEGGINGAVNAERMDLDDFKYLLSEEELGPSGSAFGGVGNASIEVRGTVREPLFSALIEGRGISFRGVPIGDLHADFSYADSLLRANVEVQDSSGGAGDTPILRATGYLPVNLALAGVQNRISGRQIDMTVVSRGLPIAVFDPLLPTFNEMTGVLTCDLRILGDLQKPEYSGTFTVPQSTFLFVPNNITYALSGTFAAEGERVRVIEAVVSNFPGDEQGKRLGSVTVTGDFSLKNLKPGEFDLRGQGALLVVKESTRSSDLSVYGNLFVEIAEGGLRFTGEVRNSLLKGDLLIRNSNLVFPPTTKAAQEQTLVSIPVTVIDDTTHRPSDVGRSAEERYFVRSKRARLAKASELARVSFMDGLRYDLDIETSGGNTQIRMIFNPLSGEELEATINGKFSITGDGTRWYGDLEIERAYYNFLKRFTAEGTLRYRGDFADPLLDIRARYEGTRAVPDTAGTGRDERVVVTFIITGTRTKPSMQYEMTIDGIDYAQYRGPKSNDLQSDAIQFVVYGSFPLSAAERGDVPSDVRDKLGLSVLTGATSLLTGALSEFLRKQTGFISSVELDYSNSRLGGSPDVRLSGTAWNGYWRYGGKIFDDPLNKANFSLVYSLDAVFGAPSLRNLMVELERRVETNPLGQKSDLKQVNSARIYYRFSF